MLSPKIAEAIVTEDNAGGLSLFVFSDPTRSVCVYARTGYEHNATALADDVNDLLRGGYPLTDWEDGVSNPQSLWDDVASWLDKSWREGVDHMRIALRLSPDILSSEVL